MRTLLRIPIEGGGSLLVEAEPGAADGPVRAGRIGTVIEDTTLSLQTALGSVRETSRILLEQLRAAGPHEVEVEFGVELTGQVGAVIARAEGGCHLIVKLVWKNDAEQTTAE